MKSILALTIVRLQGPLAFAAALAVALASQTQSTLAQPPTLPLRTNLVVVASSVTDPAIGTACTLNVEPASNGQFNCRVRVECGSRVAYGAGTAGLNTCQLAGDGALVVHDLRSDDGDPALSLVVRPGSVTASVSTDTWRMALSLAPVQPAAVQQAAVPVGVAPTTTVAPGARQARASDCLVQDQRGVVSVRCGAVSARCSRVARLDAHSDSDPHGAQVAMEAHSCSLGDRAVVAVVVDRAGTRQVEGVAPLSDRPAQGRLQRVQGAELVVTAPLGALPVDPNALHSGTGRQVIVLTWLDASGAQWQSAIHAASGVGTNLGTFATCSGTAAAANDRATCLTLRPHQAACALTHRWTLAVRPPLVDETQRGLHAFHFGSIVADPLTGILSESTTCDLPFELVTSIHPMDYYSLGDPGDTFSNDLDGLLRFQQFGTVINASHRDFATALRAAGVRNARWEVRNESASIYVNHGVDYLPQPGRCPGPVVGLTASYNGPQWLITYDQAGGPRAQPIQRTDPRLSVNQCME
jgi:hypothetical protein